MNSDELLKSTNLQQVATKGAARYEELKGEFEPNENGRFVAIDIESGDSYLGDSSADAVVTARKQHPNKVFYVVKIGYDAAETMAHLLHGTK